MKTIFFTFFFGVILQFSLFSQQKFTVGISEIEALNKSGYLKVYAYQDLVDQIRTRKQVSIFYLLDCLKAWKPFKYSPADKTTMAFPDAFINGGLEALRKEKIISSSNYSKIRTLIETGKIKEDFDNPYINIVALVLWKEYFQSKAHLDYINSLFLKNELIADETYKALAQKNLTGQLKLEDIIKGIRIFTPLNIKNENVPIDGALQQIGEIFKMIKPRLIIQKGLTYPDSSMLEPGEYFKRGEKYYSVEDSSAIIIGRVCDLHISLDSLSYSISVYFQNSAEHADSLNVWQFVFSDRLARIINQLFIDTQTSGNLMFVDLGDAGMWAQSYADDNGWFNAFPELRILPANIPAMYKGSADDIFKMENTEEKLDLINGVKQENITQFNFYLRRNIRNITLIPYSKKRRIAKFLFEEDLLDHSNNAPEKIVDEIEQSFVVSAFDILCRYDVKSLKIEIADGILTPDEFTQKRNPLSEIMGYFKKISENKFEAINLNTKIEGKSLLNVSFDLNGHQKSFTVDLSQNDPQAYLQICKSVLAAAQSEQILTDYSLYFIPLYVTTVQTNILLALKETTAQKWVSVFGLWINQL